MLIRPWQCEYVMVLWFHPIYLVSSSPRQRIGKQFRKWTYNFPLLVCGFCISWVNQKFREDSWFVRPSVDTFFFFQIGLLFAHIRKDQICRHNFYTMMNLHYGCCLRQFGQFSKRWLCKTKDIYCVTSWSSWSTLMSRQWKTFWLAMWEVLYMLRNKIENKFQASDRFECPKIWFPLPLQPCPEKISLWTQTVSSTEYWTRSAQHFFFLLDRLIVVFNKPTNKERNNRSTGW